MKTVVKTAVEPLAYNKKLLDCFVFDLDGTLALMGNREPFEWSKVGLDKPNFGAVKVAEYLDLSGLTIFILTGRDEVCRELTEEWLDKQRINYDHLLMRKRGDNRQDTIVKKEIYDAKIRGNYNVLAIFEDRKRMVNVWRNLGLTCFQVAEGDY